MKEFFPMNKWEAGLLAFLVAMAVVAFLPIWRTIEIGGMVVFGWLLATLMVLAPTLALLVFRHTDRADAGNVRNDQAGFERESDLSPPDRGKD